MHMFGSMKTHRDIIDKWGPLRGPFADDIGAGYRAAYSMYERNSINPDYFPAVVEAARKRGFEGVTLKLLYRTKPPRKCRANVEHSIQVAVFNQFQLRKTPGARLIAIPNGGARSTITGKMLKDEGVQAGTPDTWGRAPQCEAFWLEIKTRDGKLSAAQKAMHADLTALGERVFTAYGLDEALEVLKREGVIR